MDERAQAALSSWFDQTAARVKQDADRIESDYFIPWRNAAQHSYEQNPVSFSFLAIFVGLSILPIASFLGFVVLSTSVLSFCSLAFAVLVSSFVIVCSAFVLFGVLIALLCVAGCLTLTGVAAYLLARLFFHLRDPAGQGLRGWSDETRANASWAYAQGQQQQQQSNAQPDPADDSSTGT